MLMMLGLRSPGARRDEPRLVRATRDLFCVPVEWYQASSTANGCPTIGRSLTPFIFVDDGKAIVVHRLVPVIEVYGHNSVIGD